MSIAVIIYGVDGGDIMSEQTEMQEALSELRRAISIGAEYRRDYTSVWDRLQIKAARRNAVAYWRVKAEREARKRRKVN